MHPPYRPDLRAAVNWVQWKSLVTVFRPEAAKFCTDGILVFIEKWQNIIN